MTTDINTDFTRYLLQQGMAVVRKHTTVEQRKSAWVYRFNLGGRATYEFHGPDKFYWHGRAENAYEARYKGWMAWLQSQGLADER